MSSITNYTKLAQIPLFIANIGFGIYTVIILSSNPREIISDEVYAFVISICIINFIRSLSNINKLFQTNDENGCISKIIPCILLIELGMIIWSCIILFGQNGIDYKSDNPFYMVVFVYFIMSVISVGLLIVLLPFICCCILNDSKSSDISNIHNLSSISVIN